MRSGPAFAGRAVALGALGVAALAGSSSSLRGEAKPIARHDIPYSTEVVTPHVPWAKKLPGGPIRGFFVPPVTEGRDMVELMQRLSLEPTTVTIDRNWDVNCWGIGDFYDSEHVLRGDRDDFRIVYGYVEEELLSAKPFEVLVIPGLNGWSRHTRKARDAILRRVSEGAGLVLLHPFVGDVKGHPFLGRRGGGRRADLGALAPRGRGRRPRERPRLSRAQPGGDHRGPVAGAAPPPDRGPRPGPAALGRAGRALLPLRGEGRRGGRGRGASRRGDAHVRQGPRRGLRHRRRWLHPRGDRPGEDPHLLGLLGVPVLPRSRAPSCGPRAARVLSVSVP